MPNEILSAFLNALTSSAGRKEAEALMNPDVLKVEWRSGVFTWERQFRLAGQERVATTHRQTPREKAAETPNLSGRRIRASVLRRTRWVPRR